MIETCRFSAKGLPKSVMKLRNAPSALKMLWRSLSPSCSNRAWAWRSRPKRKPRPEFSVPRSASPIVSGRVPLARCQNLRNGGSSGAAGCVAATAERLGGLALPRALRRGARREVHHQRSISLVCFRHGTPFLSFLMVRSRVCGSLGRPGSLAEMARSHGLVLYCSLARSPCLLRSFADGSL